MHETYEDCPYYEQMQYSMDTQLQMLFSYQLSPDDRLARKAIHDFHSSLLPCGLLLSSFPSKFPQVIPGFSLFFIKMLYDHYLYYGDSDIIIRYMPTVEAILNYFERNLHPVYGMACNLGYWQFVDWVREWDENYGVPPVGESNILTVYNMMYVYALRLTAVLCDMAGIKSTGREWKKKAFLISRSIKKYVWCPERKQFRDSPGLNSFSQHAQIWAVLAEVITGQMAKELMIRTLKDPTLAQCSYCMTHYMFRALSKVGLYHLTEYLWKPWFDLLDLHVTTWPEDTVTARSDCHAWGALPLYEFTAELLGVKPEKPGYEIIKVMPNTLSLKSAKGQVATKWGTISVSWHIHKELFTINIELPKPISTVIYLPDGQILETNTKKYIKASCLVGAHQNLELFENARTMYCKS